MAQSGVGRFCAHFENHAPKPTFGRDCFHLSVGNIIVGNNLTMN